MIAPLPRPAAQRFRRVVVAFDGACDEDLAAVEAGAGFAARLHAELLGLFIEDIDLARLAEHPGVFTLGAFSAGRRPGASGHLGAVLRAQLVRTRQALDRAAQHRCVRASFEVRRGRVIAEILTAVAPADLVIIGWRGRPDSVMASGTPAAVVVAAMCEAATPYILLPRPAAVPAGPIIVGFDGGACASGAVAAAAELAGGEGRVEVALLAGADRSAEDLHHAAARILRDLGLGATLIAMPREGLDILLALARARGAGLLVVPAPLLDAESAKRIVEHAPCSVLLVREGQAEGGDGGTGRGGTIVRNVDA